MFSVHLFIWLSITFLNNFLKRIAKLPMRKAVWLIILYYLHDKMYCTNEPKRAPEPHEQIRENVQYF